MKRHAVTSSNIKSIGYDHESKKMEVQFSNGSVYEYHDVDADVHKGLMGADSIGSHFHKHIKPHYKGHKQ